MITRRKKIISLFIALIVIIGVIFVLPLTAGAANVTIGSSLFTNTKNMTIKGTNDGIALRVDQKEFAYAEWSSTLIMNNFSMDFKIIDDNFKKLVLTFTSMYKEEDSNDYDAVINNANRTEKEIKAIIQPEKAKNVITLTKAATGINVNINGVNKNEIGSGFKDLKFTVSYDDESGLFSVASGEKKSEAAVDNEGKPAKIVNNEANLKIEFNDITEIRKDTKNDKDETIEGASTLLIEKMSYKNINNSEQQEQSFKGTTVADTSKPVLKADTNLLTASEVYVPLKTQYKIPVYGLDAIKSLSSLSLNATVKYYKDANDNNPESITVNNMAFQVDKAEAGSYYLIEKITINDGSNLVNFENKDGSINKIGNISLPIKVMGVARTDNSDAAKSFKFNIGKDYAELFQGIPLKGGSKNKITFPMPIVGSADYETTGETGVRSYVNGVKEKENYISYKLWYQHVNDNADSWTENSAFGLSFTATKTGNYNFKIEAYDRQGNRFRCDTIITLTFKDSEEPEMTVSNFPDEVIVNEKFNVPAASISDNYGDTPTKDIALYYLKEDGITKGERIELASDNSFTPGDDMLGKSFIVVYNASKKAEGLKAAEIERVFKVVEAKETPKPFIPMNTLSIVFLCLGGVSLLGIIAMLLIKPKEKQN